MNRRSNRAGVLALVFAFAASVPVVLPGCGRGSHKTATPAPTPAKAAKYYCPMHPTYTSDKPGTCPICNMNLVPMPAEPAAGDHGASQAHGGPSADASRPGQTHAPSHVTVNISSEKQQLIGVRLAAVESAPLRKTIRAVGKVDYDETRLHHVHTKVEGWIGKLYVSSTGQWVKAGEPMFSVYSPELVATQQEYLSALQAARTATPAAAPDSAAGGLQVTAGTEPSLGPRGLVASVQRRLELWDIDVDQLAAIERAGQPLTYLDMVSHVSGVVVEKNVLEGMRIMPGEELYKLADLSQVWVTASIYEYELPLVKVGLPATITLAYSQGDTLRGRLAYVYPYLDEGTRTGQVRLDVPNPGMLLKPGMFANVEIQIDLGNGLTVPNDAVLDSGERQLAFVALGEGAFEPRTVQVGQRLDGRVQIVGGLRAGEQVVSGAQFLIDSESQLRAALQGMSAASEHQH